MPVMIKRRFEPRNNTTVWKFRNLQGFVWKITQAWMGGKSCFSHTNPFYFRRPLQSLFEIYGWKLTGYLILICYFETCLQNVSKASCRLTNHVIKLWKRPIMQVLERWSTCTDRLPLNLQRFSHQDQPHSMTVSKWLERMF